MEGKEIRITYEITDDNLIIFNNGKKLEEVKVDPKIDEENIWKIIDKIVFTRIKENVI